MGTVLLCGRSRLIGGMPNGGLVGSLPGHGRNLTNHLSCTCSKGCVTRIGVKCGNSRGFTGKRH